ncbi:MAG TPA: hypothetical protein VIT68_01460, partial [Candidatus Gracilibacteria bacterium]
MYFIYTPYPIWAQNFDPIVPGLQLSVEIPDGVATDIQFAELVKKASQEALQNQQLESYFDRHFEATGAYGQLNNGALAEDWDNLAKFFGLSVTTLLGAYALWRGRKKAGIEALTSGNSEQIDSWFEGHLDLEANLDNAQADQIVLKSGEVITGSEAWTDHANSKGLGAFGGILWSLALLWKKRKKDGAKAAPVSAQWGTTDWHKGIEDLFKNTLDEHTSWNDFSLKSQKEYQALQTQEIEAIKAKYPKLVPPVFDPNVQNIKDTMKYGSFGARQLSNAQSSYINEAKTPQEKIEAYLRVAEEQATAYMLLSKTPQHKHYWRYHMSYWSNAQNYGTLVYNMLNQQRGSLGESTYQALMTKQSRIWNQAHENASIVEVSQKDFDQKQAAYQKELDAQNQQMQSETQKVYQLYNQARNYQWQYWQYNQQKVLDQGNFEKMGTKLEADFKTLQQTKAQDHQSEFTSQLTGLLEDFSWEDLEALKGGKMQSEPVNPDKFTKFMAQYEDRKAKYETLKSKEEHSRWMKNYGSRVGEYRQIQQEFELAKASFEGVQQTYDDYLKQEFSLYGQTDLNPNLEEVFAEKSRKETDGDVVKNWLGKLDADIKGEIGESDWDIQKLLEGDLMKEAFAQPKSYNAQYQDLKQSKETEYNKKINDLNYRLSRIPQYWGRQARSMGFRDFWSWYHYKERATKSYRDQINKTQQEKSRVMFFYDQVGRRLQAASESEKQTVESYKAFIPRAKKLYQEHLDRVAQKHRVVQFTRQLEHLGKDNDYFHLGYEHLGEIVEINDQISKIKDQIAKAETTSERYGLEDQLKTLQEKKETLTQDLFNLKSVADGLIDIDFVDEPVIEDWESAQSSYYQRLLEKNPVYQYLQEREKQKAFYAKYGQDTGSYDFATLARNLEADVNYYNQENYPDGQVYNMLSIHRTALEAKVDDYKRYRTQQLPKKMIWYPWNNRSGKSYAYIEDYKDAKWEQLHMDYYRQANIYNNSQRTQEAKEAIEAYRIELEDRRRAQW